MISLSAHDKAVLNSVFNPSLPLDDAFEDQLPESLKDEEPESEEITRTKPLELEAIRLADEGNLIKAHEILTRAIGIAPKFASLYNNRAQVYRMQGQVLDAFNDLTIAIDLSNGKGKTGCQAFCQRGLLHRKAGRNQLAKDDFTQAAKLGSAFAKSQLVEMNPYAALCNQMLQQIFQKQFNSNES